MVKLSDLQVALLLEEISFAMKSGRSVSEAMNRLRSRRLGNVGRAAGMIAEALDRGENVASAFKSSVSQSGGRAAAAILASGQCGDANLVARVARQLRRRSELARDSRIAWLYPCILLMVGYGVALGVMAPLVRHLHNREMQWSDQVVNVAYWLETNWWIPPLVVFGVMVVLVAWNTIWHTFPRPARYGLFCGSLADQFRHNVPEDKAIKAAAAVAGDRSLMSIKSPSLSSPRVVRVLAPAKSFLNVANAPVSHEALIARLRYLAAIYGERARRQGHFWSRLVPRIAMVAIGGGLVFTYVWYVIAPVYRQVASW